MQSIKRLGVMGLVAAALLGILLVPVLMQQPAQVWAANENGTRDVITPTNLSDAGITQTLSAASGDGHKFSNNGREIVVVTNNYTASVTLTVVTGGTAGGIPINDVTVTLTAGTTKIVGPFNTAIYNQNRGADAGRIYLDFSAAVTGTVANSVTLAVFRIPPQ